MACRQGKFAIDQNKVRWTLLEGVITRKNYQDAPMAGKELPVSRVTAVEKVTVVQTQRSRWGVPVTLLAVGLLVLSWWLWPTPVGILAGLLGLVCFYWGTRRIPSRKVVLDGYQMVAPSVAPEDWLVVGSSVEVLGFVEGVKAELAEEATVLEA